MPRFSTAKRADHHQIGASSGTSANWIDWMTRSRALALEHGFDTIENAKMLRTAADDGDDRNSVFFSA